MKIICIDYSKSKRSFRTNRRIFGQVLLRLTSRVYSGNLPLRAIEELIIYLKINASKSTGVLILVEKKDGYHGWASFKIGSNSLIDSKVYYPDDNRLIRMHDWENIPQWKKESLKFKRLEDYE